MCLYSHPLQHSPQHTVKDLITFTFQLLTTLSTEHSLSGQRNSPTVDWKPPASERSGKMTIRVNKAQPFCGKALTLPPERMPRWVAYLCSFSPSQKTALWPCWEDRKSWLCCSQGSRYLKQGKLGSCICRRRGIARGRCHREAGIRAAP